MDGMATAGPDSAVILFTTGDVRRSYDPGSFARGFSYYSSGRAGVEAVDTDAHCFSGHVRGSKNYLVTVTVVYRSGTVCVANSCTCPLGEGCKHGVALACAYAHSRDVHTFVQATKKPVATPMPTAEAFSPVVSTWLKKFADAATAPENAEAAERIWLLYLLQTEIGPRGFKQPLVSAASVKLKTDGIESAKATLLEIERLYAGYNTPSYVRQADIETLLLMSRLSQATGRRAHLNSEGSAALMPKLLATGRCRWQSASGPALRMRETRPGRLGWAQDINGDMHLYAEDSGGGEALNMPEPWYVDPAEGVCGRLDLGIAPAMTAALMLAPGRREMGERLRGKSFAAPALPAQFRATLRPYQQTGVGWMQLLRDVGLGGVLADDMGLGKTVQTLAHLAIEKEAGQADLPSLIVAPTSVLPNWQREIAAFTPWLSVLKLHGLERRAQFGAIGGADIVLTTYPLLPRDIEILAAQPWHLVVIDEAQAVKNPVTAAAQALRRLEARQRLALSGTPLENHLGELWALFDFVLPGFLSNSRHFTRMWRTPIEKGGDRVKQEALARRCRPFMLRRTKALVAARICRRRRRSWNISNWAADSGTCTKASG